MRAYSIDLRQRVVRAAQSGKPVSEVSRVFGVGVSTIRRYLAQAQQGDLAPRISSGRPRHIAKGEQGDLVRQLAASPDATLEEHCLAWQESHGVRVSVATMHRSIGRLGYTLKKRRSAPASRTKPFVGSGGKQSQR
ncbi:MAG: IS630 transposase-related protein [Chloroflexota bacterium]